MSHKVYYITQNQPLCNQHNYQCAYCAKLHTSKQIDLQALLLLQLPYCVSVLLLTSRCKLVTAQYKQLHTYHTHLYKGSCIWLLNMYGMYVCTVVIATSTTHV